MTNIGSAVCEALSTLLTCERFFACVDTHVTPVITALCKPLATLLTLVRLLTGVYADVHSQRLARLKRPRTYVAFILPNVSSSRYGLRTIVLPQMLLKVTIISESFVTMRTSEFFHSRVCLNVGCQVSGIRELCVAILTFEWSAVSRLRISLVF